MRFTLSSTALSNKLNMLAKVIGGKNSLPILDCFLFQVAGGEMTITASDSDNILKTTIELTECDGEGEFCIPKRLSSNLSRNSLSSHSISISILRAPWLSRSYTRMVSITLQRKVLMNILAHRALTMLHIP